MPLLYTDKLKTFHDTFVKYVCSHVQRQKIMDHGFEAPTVSSSSSHTLQSIEKVPVMNIAALALELWNSRGITSQTKKIRALFLIEEKKLINILSEGIQKVGISLETLLEETDDIHKIGSYASKAATKFLTNFDPDGGVNSETISKTILKQYGWLSSFGGGDIFATSPPIFSNNYHFISEADLVEYIDHSKLTFTSLSIFLRKKYNLEKKIQIVLNGYVNEATKLITDTSYLSLNGYEFNSEIFRLDRIESSLRRMQAQQSSESSPISTQSLNNRLKKIYALQNNLPKLIDDNDIPTQDMDNYHIKLELVETSKESIIEQDQIFIIDSQQEVSKILIISDVGKTSFLINTARNWGKYNLYEDKFLYLFKIDLQLFTSDWTEDYSREDLRNNLLRCFIDYSIRQEILNAADQLLPEDNIMTKEIFNIIDITNTDKILLIVDNYEYLLRLSSQSIRAKNIIEQIFRFKYIIVACSSNILSTSIEDKFDRIIKSNGYSQDGTVRFINIFFEYQQNLLDQAVKEYFQNRDDQTLLTYFNVKRGKLHKKVYSQLKRIQEYKNIDAQEDIEVITRIINEFYCRAKFSLLQLIKENVQIRELTSSPLDLTILCLVTLDYSDLLRFKEHFNTIELYEEFILWIGKRYIIKKQASPINSKDISLARVLNTEELNILQHIAYEAFKSDKEVFSGHFIDEFTYSTKSINIREIYNFGLLKIEPNNKVYSLLDQRYLFINPYLQQYLVARRILDLLSSNNEQTSREAAEFIAHHRNEPKYLVILKYMAGLIQTKDSLVAIKFWESILCNVNGLLELGTEGKAALLMHLLGYIRIDRTTKYLIPYKETMVIFIDDLIIKDDSVFLRWSGHIKATGYLSDRMLEYVLNVISGSSPPQSQILIEWDDSEKSDIDLLSSIMKPDSSSVIKQSFVSILYSLINKFAHHKLYNNKRIFYVLKPYLLDIHTNSQTLELVIKIFTDLIINNKSDFLNSNEHKELFTESITLIRRKNLQEPVINLIKTIIQTTDNQETIDFAISRIRKSLDHIIAIDIITRIPNSYNNLVSLTFELLIFDIGTSNYIDFCTTIDAISKLPTSSCSPNHFIKDMIKKLFLLLDKDEAINCRIMRTINEIVLNNVLDRSTSEFIIDLITPVSKDPNKSLAYYVVNTIISRLTKTPKTILDQDRPDYSSYRNIIFSPLDSISSSSQDIQYNPQIDFIDFSCDSLSYFLRNEDPMIRFLTASKLNSILIDSTTELKLTILNNLKTLLSTEQEMDNSGVIYTIGKIVINNDDILKDGLAILLPILTSDDSRISYSAVFAISSITPKTTIPIKEINFILDKLILLLKMDNSAITYNAIEAIGNVAIIAIDLNYEAINNIFDAFLNILSSVQQAQGLNMLKATRQRTYPAPPTYALSPTRVLLQLSPETTTRKMPTSQPITEVSYDNISPLPDIDDIVPSIAHKNSLSATTINSLLKIITERNYQANKIILIKIINIAKSSTITPQLSNIVCKIINYMPLNKAINYLKTPYQQINYLAIEAITLKLKEPAEKLSWHEHIKISLNIIGIEIFEQDLLEKRFHEAAKKYLKIIISSIDTQKLEWINSKFDQLSEISSHTSVMMKDIYHIVLRDEKMTPVISVFLINCITKLGFTMTISKSTSEPRYTIICTERYTFYGEENLQYLEILTNAAMTIKNEPLVDQYLSNIPVFHNTGSAIMLAASDIEDVRSIVTTNKLKVNEWEISLLYCIADKIVLLEKRNYFGEYEIYKIKLLDGILKVIKFQCHPHNIGKIIQEIYGGVQYIKSEIAINTLEIQVGYEIISLVDIDPQTIVSFLDHNDISTIIGSKLQLSSSPKEGHDLSHLEYSKEKPLTSPNKRQNEQFDDIEESRSPKKIKTTPSKDIEALSLHHNYKNNPDTDSDIFCLHQITYDNPPPLYPQIDNEFSKYPASKSTPKTQQEYYQSPPLYNNNLFLLSFMSKEYIESAPILKYFWKNMLHLPIPELPDIMNNIFFWIAAHYITCQIGIFSISGQLEFKSSLLISAPYAIRLAAYTFTAERQQIALLNDDKKDINTLQNFFDKCGLNIAIHTVIGLTYSAPLIAASTGGLNCYYSHKKESIEELSSQAEIIPYITSISAGYLTITSMSFDYPTGIEEILAIDQTLILIQSMVVAHDTTTLLLLTTQDVRAPIYDYISNIIGDLYDYYFKGGEEYEQ